MPIKKDETGKRWVEMQLFVPGTPEQVWHALATGPGYSAWFMKAEIDGRVGGKLKLYFGDGSQSEGEVTAWEPPQHLAYVERDWAEGAPPVATEITITSRSGERCVVRMVHSLFTSDEQWEDQLEGFEAGWPGFFEVLRVYLRHFAGQEAASFMASTGSGLDAASSWRRLVEAIGASAAAVGERAESPTLPEPWSGVVEHVHQDDRQRFMVLRLEHPSPGIALVGTYDRDGKIRVSVCRYLYGDEADARAVAAQPAWQQWLNRQFGS